MHVCYDPSLADIRVALLTGGRDKHYALGLATALLSRGILLDFVGSGDVEGPELYSSERLKFVSLRGKKRAHAAFTTKILQELIYYVRLIRYAATAQPKIFHILWNNRFELFDRTVLMIFYKLLGKTVVFHAHNVNAGRRDGDDSFLNRASLTAQYRLSDHIFVHTTRMKSDIIEWLGITESAITVIPYGMNNAVPHTSLTGSEAKQRLGIRTADRTILFFGSIRPYKGLEYLVSAFLQLAKRNSNYRLIIAGTPKKECAAYFADIQQMIISEINTGQIIERIEFIPDEDTELYFKAADVLVLPYVEIFQSGVLFLGYSFGLPAIVTDVGSLGEEIVEGRTGLICSRCDSDKLAATIDAYFESDLFRSLESLRQEIRDYVEQRHSWRTVAEIIGERYATMLRGGGGY